MRFILPSSSVLLLLSLAACAGSDRPAASPAPAPPPPAIAAAAEATAASSHAESSPPAQAAPSPAPPATPHPLAASIDGTLVSRAGGEAVVRIDGSDVPTPGAKASLSKHFEGKPGDDNLLGALGGLLGGSIEGWMQLGEVTVKSVKGNEVTVTIDDETAKVVVNGQKRDQFEPGARVKLAPPK